MNVIWTLFVKRNARFASVACFAVFCSVLTIDCFSENTRASCFSHTARTAKQIGVCQMIAFNGIFQRSGQRALPHHRHKCRRPVFTRGNNIMTHVFRKDLFTKIMIFVCTQKKFSKHSEFLKLGMFRKKERDKQPRSFFLKIN